MYKVGDLVRHHVHYEVSVLAFVTAVHSRDDSMTRIPRDYITITYLKPLQGGGWVQHDYLSISPHDQLTLVSCPESVPRIQPTL
jgi:hypothetical protein